MTFRSKQPVTLLAGLSLWRNSAAACSIPCWFHKAVIPRPMTSGGACAITCENDDGNPNAGRAALRSLCF
jgi:hypothetical protein